MERICQDLIKENLKLKEKLSQHEEDKDAKNHEKSKTDQYKIKNSHNIQKEEQFTINIDIEDNDANAKAKLTKSQSLNLNDIDKRKSNIVVQDEYIMISDSLEPEQNRTELFLITGAPSVNQRAQKRKFETKLSSEFEYLEDDISKQNEIDNTNTIPKGSIKQDNNKSNNINQINKYVYPKVFKKAKKTDDNAEKKHFNNQIIQINLDNQLIENEQMDASSITKFKDRGTTAMDNMSCKLDKLYEHQHQDILEEFQTPNDKPTENIPEFLRKDKDNSLHNLIAKFIGTSSSHSHASAQDHQMSNGATHNPSIDMILIPTPTDIYLNNAPDDRHCDKLYIKSFDNDIIMYDPQTTIKVLKANDNTNNHTSIAIDTMKQSIKTKHFKKVSHHFSLSQKGQIEELESMPVAPSKPAIKNPNTTFMFKPSNTQINPWTLAKAAVNIQQKAQNKQMEQIHKGNEDFVRGTHRKKAEREALNGYQCDQCEKVI